MRKIFTFGFLVAFVAGCSVHIGNPRGHGYDHFRKPKLELYVVDMNHATGEVVLEAHLLGSTRALHDPRYQCLQEFWTFGDGRALIKESPCDRFGNPRTDASRVRFAFKEAHNYWPHGRYKARLELYNRNGKRIVRSNKVKVQFYY
jgi:hypothetical protein